MFFNTVCKKITSDMTTTTNASRFSESSVQDIHVSFGEMRNIFAGSDWDNDSFELFDITSKTLFIYEISTTVREAVVAAFNSEVNNLNIDMSGDSRRPSRIYVKD